MDGLQPGLAGEARRRVDATNTAATMGSGTEPVFATPAMAALMEEAAVSAVATLLAPDETTVGVQLEIQHLAATPIGMQVRATALLTSVEGRTLTFDVAAYDESEQIGVGTHRRALVNRERFLQRIASKVKV